MKEINGSCHCGKVLWKASLPIKTVVQCHCHSCRKLQGADYSNWAVIPKTQFEVTDGKGFVSQYQFTKRSEKLFCSCCGSVIYGLNGKHFPGHILISPAMVNNLDMALKPQIEVYCEDKVPWLK